MCVWRCVCCCCQTEREVSSRDASRQLFLWIWSVQWASDSYSRILRSLNLSQNQANSAIFQIAADFALRRVFWRHRNAHSVKERLFLNSKNGMNSFAFSSCPIYKSYIGQTNRKRIESALLVWATDRLSARTGAASCSRSRDTVIHSAGRYSEIVEFTAESITSLSNLVRSIQILLKLQTSK